MKTKVLMKSIIFALTLSSSAFAGFGAGNGGMVIKCDDQENYELADFYEVRTMEGLKNKMKVRLDASTPYRNQVKSSIEKLSQIILSFGIENGPNTKSALSLLNKKLQSLDNIEWFENDISFPHTRDLGRFIIRGNCNKPINAIAYYENNIIDGQTSLFNELHPTHQAGLFVHEVVYAMTREMNTAKTSLPARRITALLFSDYKDDNYLLRNLVLEYLILDKSKVMSRIPVSKNYSKATIEVNPIFECFKHCGSSVYLNGKNFNEVKKRRLFGSKTVGYKMLQKLPALIEVWGNEIMPEDEIFIKNIRLNLKVEGQEINIPKVHKYLPDHLNGKFSLFYPLVDQKKINEFLYPSR